MSLELTLDILMVTLLTLTIWFCWRLNNKITALKESRNDLSEMVKTFDSAIVKTHKNVAELKAMSTSSAAELQLYINKAGELIEDLSFMTEAAARVADRLEGGITAGRHSTQAHSVPTTAEHFTPVPPSGRHATGSNAKPKAEFSPSQQHPAKAANDMSGQDATPFARTSQDLLNAIRNLEAKE